MGYILNIIRKNQDSSLRKIGRRAFKGCSSLVNIILPIDVEEVGYDAFADCTSLSRIALPRGIRELEDIDVFGGCDSLELISYGGDEAGWKMLTRSDTLSIRRSDNTVSIPKILFMDLKK